MRQELVATKAGVESSGSKNQGRELDALKKESSRARCFQEKCVSSWLWRKARCSGEEFREPIAIIKDREPMAHVSSDNVAG
jgi:hypothetical protein